MGYTQGDFRRSLRALEIDVTFHTVNFENA